MLATEEPEELLSGVQCWVERQTLSQMQSQVLSQVQSGVQSLDLLHAVKTVQGLRLVQGAILELRLKASVVSREIQWEETH